MSRANIFIIGLDAFNRAKLERLPQAAECGFHSALGISDIRNVEEFDMPALIDRAEANIESAGVSVDAIASYDRNADHVWLLEINPRISQAHTDIFAKVHGVSHHSVMVDLSLGHKPKPMERQGLFNIAAHFLFRTSESGRVQRVPSEAAIERLKKRQPGTEVKIPVRPGQHLRDLQGQDMYSFEIANVFIGGRDPSELLDKYDEALSVLQFDIEKDIETVIT
ncbi:MAG: hypothetical protein ACQETK_01135 [Pseudomonadota bacterium]